jgi:hypothetical protein
MSSAKWARGAKCCLIAGVRSGGLETGFVVVDASEIFEAYGK